MKGEGCFVRTTIDLNVEINNIHTSNQGNTCVYILYIYIYEGTYYKIIFYIFELSPEKC